MTGAPPNTPFWYRVGSLLESLASCCAACPHCICYSLFPTLLCPTGPTCSALPCPALPALSYVYPVLCFHYGRSAGRQKEKPPQKKERKKLRENHGNVISQDHGNTGRHSYMEKCVYWAQSLEIGAPTGVLSTFLQR
jgi:hypothetical protein